MVASGVGDRHAVTVQPLLRVLFAVVHLDVERLELVGQKKIPEALRESVKESLSVSFSSSRVRRRASMVSRAS